VSHYRKIDTRIWNDAKFRALDDTAKLVFFMLLTHPSMTMLGAMRATTAGLAEEMAMPLKAFREAFGQVLQQGMAEQDAAAHLIALPNFLKYNRPESPNVVKSWATALDLLPECALKTSVVARSKAFAEGMSKAFGEALPEAFRRTYPNQEQEQEQEYSGATAPARPTAERHPPHGLSIDDLDRYGFPGQQTGEQMERELWDAGKDLLINGEEQPRNRHRGRARRHRGAPGRAQGVDDEGLRRSHASHRHDGRPDRQRVQRHRH
jgi:hypothetical protein